MGFGSIQSANCGEGCEKPLNGLAYDVSGAGIDGLTGTVIAYRGSDYEDTNGDILRSNDLWQGWTVGAAALQRRKGAM